ncbi:MAG: glycosyltransferase [Gallionella sp.]|nr:glycosyltransferase [Gallionella sp.]MDD5612837.1 glycosyltransferase [Gallionella sp.]
MNDSVLFIAYDGLLDQLGGSQILPYLRGIAAHPRYVHIVSFEKPARFAVGAEKMRADLARDGIGWTPVPFTSRFGKLGKLWDLGRMYATCLRLQLKHRFGIVHCRSYMSMQVGAFLHRLTGVKAIFDMRGLWVDERVDGGLWKQDRWLNRVIYRTYKRIERNLLASASHVVVLTRCVVPELKRLSPAMSAPVTIIPCCADFDHFVMPSGETRQAVRAELGIPPDAMVLSYLGSLGTWYMLEDMLRLFAAAAGQRDDVYLLFITRDWQDEQEDLLKTMGIGHLRARIHVRSASREEVPSLMAASDIMLSFIKPAYSKMGSCPTKLAEAFALGIPVISNVNVGDVEQITDELAAGATFDLDDAGAFERLAGKLEEIKGMGGAALRERARKTFGLEVAENSYRQVYETIEQSKCCR